MKTPVEELFEKLWNTDKDKLTWYGIYNNIRRKEEYEITNTYKRGYRDGYASGSKLNSK